MCMITGKDLEKLSFLFFYLHFLNDFILFFKISFCSLVSTFKIILFHFLNYQFRN
jgi:hypothetical protein